MVDVIEGDGPQYKAFAYSALRGKVLDEDLKCVNAQLEGLKSRGRDWLHHYVRWVGR
jgi:hypothetical protein